MNIKTHSIKNDVPLFSESVENYFESNYSHSAITMQFRVSRKPGYFVINCLLPTLMITLCVFFTFLMDYSRFQYRFSLLFTIMLTSITFRWAIHGRVLPTISYMTFLDVYCVSSILIVFLGMVWHAIYLTIYKEDEKLAEICDRYALITFAVIVFFIHVSQTIWFLIAIRKRIQLEKLDQRAALNYLKNRMMYSKKLQNKQITNDTNINTFNQNVNSNANNFFINKDQIEDKDFSNVNISARNIDLKTNKNLTTSSNLQSKRMLYSFSKLNENSVITILSNDTLIKDNAKGNLKSDMANKNNILGNNEVFSCLSPNSLSVNDGIFSNIKCKCVEDIKRSSINLIENKNLLATDILKNQPLYFSDNKSDEDQTSSNNDLNYQY